MTKTEIGAFPIKKVCVPQKKNVVPNMMRQKVRPEDLSEHGAPRELLRFF